MILNSEGNGVVGILGRYGPDVFRKTTISGIRGVGYHGTSQGFPIMEYVVITGNFKGGFLADNVFAGGAPSISKSNLFDNRQFDVYLQSGNSMKLTNVHLGTDASKRLEKEPQTRLRNIKDARDTKRDDAGIVLVENVSVKPLPEAGASAAVIRFAEDYAKVFSR